MECQVIIAFSVVMMIWKQVYIFLNSLPLSLTNFKWYMKLFTDQTQDQKKLQKSKYWDSYRKFSGGYYNRPGTLPKQSWGNELQLIILKVNKISWIHHGFQQPSLLYRGTHNIEVSVHSSNYNAYICILFPIGMYTCQNKLALQNLLWNRVLYDSEFREMTSSKHQPIKHMPNASHF